MTFAAVSPSGMKVPGYSHRDALYAACVLAEKERRFMSRKSAPVAVYEDGKRIADVWADAQEDVTP
jgi:hypothetical protein